MTKKFIYIPSFSAGSYGHAITKDQGFKNGKPIRLYDENMDHTLRNDWFLAPAGHFYKKLEYRDKIKIPKNSNVNLLGDSGGFQIATGALKWTPELKHQIFIWLEENSSYAVNLDIPPKILYEGKFTECLEISKENFKYFYEKQTGKTKFLNVLQGEHPDQYQIWYDNVKQFEFNGWCLGGCGGSLHKFMAAVATFIDNKEHLNDKNEILHILGVSKIIDFFILSQLQKSLNEIGSDIQVTTDSSSPNNGSRFGTYYTHADLKTGAFKNIHIPKPSLGKDFKIIDGLKMLPKTSTCDNWLEDCYDWEDLYNYTPDINCIIVLHNYGVFRDTKNIIDELVNGHPYFMEQMVSSDIVKIVNIVETMVLESLNGTSAKSIYLKNKHYINAASHRLFNETNIHPRHDFF